VYIDEARQSLTLNEYLIVLLRRGWVIVFPFVVVNICTVIAASGLTEPRRSQALMGGLFGGLALGFALFAVRAYRGVGYRTRSAVSALDVPVLATIPEMWTTGERYRLSRRRRMLTLTAVAAALTCGAAAAWAILR
jgi:hypothetical protein